MEKSFYIKYDINTNLPKSKIQLIEKFLKNIIDTSNIKTETNLSKLNETTKDEDKEENIKGSIFDGFFMDGRGDNENLKIEVNELSQNQSKQSLKKFLENVPIYERATDYVLPINPKNDGVLMLSIKKCFNCGRPNHVTSECPEKKNKIKQDINRKLHSDYSVQKSNFIRYWELPEVKKNPLIDKFKPGIISDQLKKALGMKEGELPPYYYKIKFVYGYPPGYKGKRGFENTMSKDKNYDPQKEYVHYSGMEKVLKYVKPEKTEVKKIHPYSSQELFNQFKNYSVPVPTYGGFSNVNPYQVNHQMNQFGMYGYFPQQPYFGSSYVMQPPGFQYPFVNNSQNVQRSDYITNFPPPPPPPPPPQ